jgi:hypothetical protein
MPKGAIMRPQKYSSEHLVEIFCTEKVLTMESVARLLGNPSKRTVIRKLNDLQSRASYSHAGKYYTLNVCAEYNKYGLWSFRDIHFSQYGTLVNTILYLVVHSEEGYFASELRALLKVRVYNALSDLYSRKRLVREQIGGEYLYVSPVLQDRQLQRRYDTLHKQVSDRHTTVLLEGFSEELQDNMRFLISNLDEKQRRLYLGLESMKLGYGGDKLISKIAAVNPKTIARGRSELQAKDITPSRIRRVGAGRPPIKKNRSD